MKAVELRGAIMLQPGKPGFTLIEIIIVLFIIGVATGLAGIMISGSSDSNDVRIFAKDIANVLRYARSHSVSEKKIYCFVIDREENMFALYAEDIDYKKIEKVIYKEIPEGLQMYIDDNEKEEQFIEFFPFGNSSGGLLGISDRSGVTYNIWINRVTGKLEIGKAE